MTATFLVIILLSLGLAALSKLGHVHQRAEDFFVASGQFNAVLFFFLGVGETYSITSIFGYPGGIYAGGIDFVTWFIGYILLAFVVGYFLNPLIWRAGRMHGAVTMPDLFRRHFGSRALEVVVTCASLIFLIPLGMQQFLGLQIVLQVMHWSISPLLVTSLAGLLAFAYIAISGIRASAYVAVLKDVLVILAIILTASAALHHWTMNSQASIPIAALRKGAMGVTLQGNIFSITTILTQCVGFCIVPMTCAYVFTARSASAVRQAQITMPLYMLMFPLLTFIAYFAVYHPALRIQSANEVFPDVVQAILSRPLTGLVMAGATLSALVVLTGVCLTVGSLVSRNLIPGLSSDQQRQWSKIIIVAYLLLSIAGAATSSQLLVTINNLFYFGIVQALPGMMGILFLRRMRPAAIIAGILAGDITAIVVFEFALPVDGVNAGLIGLLVNMAIVLFALRFFPDRERKPIAAMTRV